MRWKDRKQNRRRKLEDQGINENMGREGGGGGQNDIQRGGRAKYYLDGRGAGGLCDIFLYC